MESVGDVPSGTLPKRCHCFSSCDGSKADVKLAIAHHLIVTARFFFFIIHDNEQNIGR